MVLDSKVYKDAWGAAREQILRSMLAVPADDLEMKSRLVDGLKVLEALNQFFTNTITTGKISRLRLEKKEGIFGRRV